jgi:hypothetical protein
LDSEDLLSSPQLPIGLLLVITVFFAGVLLLTLRVANGWVTRFLIVAVWLRIMSGAFHQYTFAPLGAGLSINALLSVATVGIGIALVPRRLLLQPWTFPIYGLIALIVISGLYNGMVGGILDMALKWAYALVMIAALLGAMTLNGQTKTLVLLMYCYLPVFALQFTTLVLGMPKQSEADGSASYIGGYFHEATFSVMALTFSTMGYLARDLSWSRRMTLVFIGVFSIVLANYRTAMLSVLPMITVAGFLLMVTTVRAEHRRVAAAFAVPAVCFVFAALIASDGIQERFIDMFAFLGDPTAFVKPLAEFNEADIKLMSGRIAIWAGYIGGYLDGVGLQKLIGLGPNSWVGVMSKYAHNTLVSFLYELGALGVLAILTIWGTFLSLTLTIKDPVARIQLLAAQFGFFLLNMSTMPHWQIEGNIMFAAIQASVLREHMATRAARSVPSSIYVQRA